MNLRYGYFLRNMRYSAPSVRPPMRRIFARLQADVVKIPVFAVASADVIAVPDSVSAIYLVRRYGHDYFIGCAKNSMSHVINRSVCGFRENRSQYGPWSSFTDRLADFMNRFCGSSVRFVCSVFEIVSFPFAVNSSIHCVRCRWENILQCVPCSHEHIARRIE